MLRFYDPNFVYSGKENNFLEVEVSNQDLTDGTYQYFGYVSPRNGAWVIQRFHFIGSTIQYRFASGRRREDYDTHWNVDTGRFVEGSLTFTTIDQVVPI